MKANDIIEELRREGAAPEVTCDTVKAGNPEREVRRLAVTMHATVDTVKRVSDWGADMLIVHEPTYYAHLEDGRETEVIAAKRALIEKSGVVIYRHHDRMHARRPDGITEGEVHFLGLSGRVELTKYSASYIMTLDEPTTALALAERMESELGIRHVRIAGERNRPATRIALCFGTPSGVFELLSDGETEIVLTGEACEWQLGEYARDAAALGFNKSLIVMGHVGSERDGMRLLTEQLAAAHPDIEVKYFECGEVYGYTEG